MEKKTAAKKPAAKATVKKEAVKRVAKAAEPKKAAETKKTAAPAPVQSAKETAAKVSVYVQYQDREWDRESLVQTVKDIMKYDMQIDPETAKDIRLYINTEEDRVYFVVNKDLNGSFAL